MPKMTNAQPVILMTPAFNDIAVADSEREYVIRANYAEAISEAGGIPLILPYESTALPAALALADGILITGAEPGAEVSPKRSAFERALARQAIEAGKPLLGICHGMQLIGELLGGTFTTALPHAIGDSTLHMPRDIPDHLAHDIAIEPDSLLGQASRRTTARVNSLHRHALTGSGRFDVIARAADGVIEAFEGKTSGFCLGIQWHPEYRLTSLDRNILKAFVDRAAGQAANHPVGKINSSGVTVYDRLAALGLTLPEAPVPPGAFVGVVRHGRVVTLSGQVPLKNGVILATGQLGNGISIEQGQDCARGALLNALAQLEHSAGGLERIDGFIRLAGYVAATAGFTQHGAVVDGASQLLKALFPDRWEHARIAVGVSSLPRGAPVEIELTALVAEEI